jgi:Chromosome segregation ATPases
MDLIKHEKEQQVKALEEQVKRYREIIELKKESLRLTKEEDNYNKEVAKRVKDIATLQSRIDQLSLDSSREAQAERRKLEEQLAELQGGLADYQADYALDKQEEVLDAEVAAYEKAKEKEKAIIEDSISSTEKLYQLAIARIGADWDGLYSDLLAWNYQYGSTLESDLVSAWAAASRAVQEYGSYLDAVSAVQAGAASALNGSGTTVGTNKYTGTSSAAESVKSIVSQMKVYAGQWNASNPQSVNDRLHEEAARLASQLSQHGVQVSFDRSSGTWTIVKDEINPSNSGRALYNTYHTGGIASMTPTLKDNEVMAILEKGEPVLDAPKKEGLYKLIDFTTMLSERLGSTIHTGAFDMLSGGRGLLPPIASLPRIDESAASSFIFNPKIQISIEHHGSLGDADAERFGGIVADSALSKLTDAFNQRGVGQIGNSILKQ